MGNTVKSLFGIQSSAEKRAARQQEAALKSQQRAANMAGEARQALTAEEALAVRRRQLGGRKQLSWLPLGGTRTGLGNGTGVS